MIDGRFDQHFLEIFARGLTQSDAERKIPWLSFVAAPVALAFLGAAAIHLMK
jgi:hypothetical protein